MSARAIGYIVRTGAYGDSVTDYKYCATRELVEAELVDMGWMDNPALFVYKVTKGEDPAELIQSLAYDSVDPYPDWIVEFNGPHSPKWTRA